jgi:hypothetical protein
VSGQSFVFDTGGRRNRSIAMTGSGELVDPDAHIATAAAAEDVDEGQADEQPAAEVMDAPVKAPAGPRPTAKVLTPPVKPTPATGRTPRTK